MTGRERGYPSFMADKNEFGGINHEIPSSGLDTELMACQNGKDVLKVYLKLDRSGEFWVAGDQEKVALRLLEFGEADKAMEFIKMSEARKQSDYFIEKVGDKVRDLGLSDLREALTNLKSS